MSDHPTHDHADPDLPCHHEDTTLVCDVCGEVIDGCDPWAPDRFGNVAIPSDDA